MQRPAPADSVVLDAVVSTQDTRRPRAKGFAVRGGRFVAIADEPELQAWIGPETRVQRLGGAAVIPGLIDAHLHFLGQGLRLLRLDLVGCADLAELQRRLAQRVAATPEGDWIEGRGWDQNRWPGGALPRREDLDAVAPGHPVCLVRVDGHALVANSAALALAGIDGDSPEPAGGRIVRDAAGVATGVLVDEAMPLVQRLVPRPGRSELEQAARLAARECFSLGLTSLHEPGLPAAGVALLESLVAAGEPLPRIRVMVEPGEALERLLETGPRSGERLSVGGLKLYADGALGSHGAALLSDYRDRPGEQGLLLLEPPRLEALLRQALAAGIQPAVHAIGDRANRLVLDVYERVLEGRGALLRPRIEHAQLLAPEDLPRFAGLGVIASMQPIHATSDMPWIEERVAATGLRCAYAWRSLLTSGARLAFGSDAPVESPNPFWGLYAALTRQDHRGRPRAGWQARERLSFEQALELYTRAAAWAGFEEQHKGSIEPGKLADYVVLEHDPAALEPHQLLELQVCRTVLAGRQVYAAPGWEESGA